MVLMLGNPPRHRRITEAPHGEGCPGYSTTCNEVSSLVQQPMHESAAQHAHPPS
eukprot:CAMPEP_0119371680 /NCGR_PEP_ID=MMETSP1334-20130426/17800_1 /TAXON_ID=127549 /ORGANISM="Calcidiscus leptoporus, Strain RCC1130" /LENGTH=53 /DNA_ID=CAMNT_0007388997 /DNA_START=160 /DNA_END=317 /DNA_ORIENTATION=+